MTIEEQIKAGRPFIEIDWKKVDFFIEAGCSGTEIASMIGVHHDTFYNRISAEYGETFSEYSAKRRPKGDASIRVKQYQKALQGDNHMLIWLGKNRLKQKDREEIASNEPTKVVFEVNYGNNSQVEILPKTVSAADTSSPGQGDQESGMVRPS